MVKINETLDILGSNTRGIHSKLLALRAYINNEFQNARRLQTKVNGTKGGQSYSQHTACIQCTCNVVVIEGWLGVTCSSFTAGNSIATIASSVKEKSKGSC